jgi:hypothetical protein
MAVENKTQLTLSAHQEKISRTFIDFYKERGYIYNPPVSLLAKNDNSVIFVGATITPLKPYLSEGVPDPGLCMVQKCLRTKRMDEMTDINIIPEWTHYFTMCGILANPNKGNDISSEAYSLLVNDLGISPRNLAVEISSEDVDLSGDWISKGIEVRQDTHPDNYYKWRYGFSDIYGKGMNILLRIGNSEEYRDLGNLISVRNTDGATLAYEFGFGLESMISAVRGFKKPVEASLISSVIPYQEGLQEKVIDIIMAITAIYHEGIEPGTGGAKHVVKKLIKGLSFLRREMNLSLDQVDNWCHKFEQVEFGNQKNSPKIIKEVSIYEKQLSKFDDYVKNQFHAYQLRGDSREKLLKIIDKTGVNMGILSVDVKKILGELLQT